jgi:broad specificity phosphatase PhoE
MTIFHFIRHEESEGNAAAKRAKDDGSLRLHIPWPTPDIPLTFTGRLRARTITPPKADIVVTSPYARAVETMHLCMPGISFYIKDSRLVDKDSGDFDKLSLKGIETLYPEEWAERQRIGKFYHRPPNGESWEGVAVRVRKFMDQYAGRFESILAFSHDVTILCALYVAQNMTPDEILDYHKHTPIQNGSVTSIEYKGALHAVS